MGTDMAPPDPERLERDRRDADRRYNDAFAALTSVVERLNAKPALTREDFWPLAHALIVYLQQIAAFVDTKDRQLDAAAQEQLVELRTKISVLERKGVVQPSTLSPQPSSPSPQPSSSHDDAVYLAFEDQFRGAVSVIQARQSEYLPLFAG